MLLQRMLDNMLLRSFLMLPRTPDVATSAR